MAVFCVTSFDCLYRLLLASLQSLPFVVYTSTVITARYFIPYLIKLLTGSWRFLRAKEDSDDDDMALARCLVTAIGDHGCEHRFSVQTS